MIRWGRLLIFLGVLAAGATVVMVLSRSSSTPPPPPASSTGSAPAAVPLRGLVEADRVFMRSQDLISTRRGVPSKTLGYQLGLVNGAQAEVLNCVAVAGTDGRVSLWSSVAVRLAWAGGQWRPDHIVFIKTGCDGSFQPFA